ncbi:hypothetical protein [Domibacillus mangrovi]|nr:hypothetical protein [Domibacillus mangrovi]
MKLDGPFLTIFSMIKDEGMAVKWMAVHLLHWLYLLLSVTGLFEKDEQDGS